MPKHYDGYWERRQKNYNANMPLMERYNPGLWELHWLALEMVRVTVPKKFEQIMQQARIRTIDRAVQYAAYETKDFMERHMQAQEKMA